MTAIPLKKTARLHYEGFLQNVTGNVAGDTELYVSGADVAIDATAHNGVLCKDIADNHRLFAKHKARSSNVALDLSFDLKVTSRKDRAADQDFSADS